MYFTGFDSRYFTVLRSQISIFLENLFLSCFSVSIMTITSFAVVPTIKQSPGLYIDKENNSDQNQLLQHYEHYHIVQYHPVHVVLIKTFLRAPSHFLMECFAAYKAAVIIFTTLVVLRWQFLGNFFSQSSYVLLIALSSVCCHSETHIPPIGSL